MLSMLKDRNLINIFGIPLWLFLIHKGGLYYSLFILACSAFALGEFYSIMEKKGAKPLRWMGMASTVFIADYYYVQPLITPHQMLGGMIVIIILTIICLSINCFNSSGITYFSPVLFETCGMHKNIFRGLIF